ncbi:MAG: TatD family hydrolase [Sedimenticola sp.]|nr:TatD family hydrolase [Sedimenticola sp.]MCW8881202.1 TatD family hydrolase [Sedimenticola sp.]MCW8920869.1 TatD family hydrolase [Sedimenticola sp.]MCW8947636.1 TatD family hydrolase [Sedimenticola sp.]MCW8949789.1 TatD family hydrolase [Sedimenticola sp.]
MLVDSHCHLDRLDLTPFENQFSQLMEATRASGVGHILCVCIDLESYPAMLNLVDSYPEISISVGVHPNDYDRQEPTPEQLVELAIHSKNVAIGETGLDYFRSDGNLDWQRERFRNHITAAKMAKKPLIIHTRAAKADTISIMQEEGADTAGGVMHCFTEDWDMAKQALDLGFYISFSGIVTFNSAADLREVAKKVPDDRILIETDAPYLAPIPHRGKSNLPSYVGHVADKIAELRGITRDSIEDITRENFFNLFTSANRIG